jgi:predicted dienelactone hydrolase
MTTRCWVSLFESAALALLAGCGHHDGFTDEPGVYAVGHVVYVDTDDARAGRRVAMSVFYPTDPGSVTSASPPATYPFSLYTSSWGASTSADWEAHGLDRAYEESPASGAGPFPLLVFSPGNETEATWYVFIGTRLATHGYVVALLQHSGEAYTFPVQDYLERVQARPGDASFAITTLLSRSATEGELLHGTLDAEAIAVGGHSLGGYVAYAVAAGVDSVCHSLLPSTQGDPLPYPTDQCGPLAADPRVKAIVSLDGESNLMLFSDYGRVAIPTLLMGETYDHAGTWIARPHAAIARSDSYRVEVKGALHVSFWNCYPDVYVAHGLWGDGTVCDGTDPATNNALTTRYIRAFLEASLKGSTDEAAVLSGSWAKANAPMVEFFEAETCGSLTAPSGMYVFRMTMDPVSCRMEAKDGSSLFIP